MKNDLLIK